MMGHDRIETTMTYARVDGFAVRTEMVAAEAKIKGFEKID